MRATEEGVQFAIGAAIKTNPHTFKMSDSEPKLKEEEGKRCQLLSEHNSTTLKYTATTSRSKEPG